MAKFLFNPLSGQLDQSGGTTLTVGTTAGTVAAGDDARLSDSRTPTAHAASHAAAGSDPLAPSDIGAQSIFTTANASAPNGAALQLTAQRARIWTVTNTAMTGDAAIQLPLTGIQTGDVAVIRGSNSSTASLTVKSPAQSGGTVLFYTDPQNTPSGNPVVISNASHQYRFIVNDPTSFNPWFFVAVDTHTHAATAISDSTTAGRALLTGADAAAQRTSLGLGTAATSATGDFAAASHSHGNINSSGQVGSDSGRVLVTTTAGAVTTLALGTAGQVLRTKSDLSGVEFADPSGGGVTAVGTTLADILSVSGSDLVADDLGADKLYGFDDSEGKAIGFIIGSGLSVSGDTLSATASGGSKTYATFTATDNNPPATAFATIDQRNSIAVLDFDDTTDESAVFVGIMPEGASLASGLKIRLHWMSTNQTSNNVVWDVSLERMDTDLDADSFHTIASGTAAANTTQSGILTVTEITLTTIDSVTAGDAFRLKVTRDANNASDNMSNDAELVAVEVRSAA